MSRTAKAWWVNNNTGTSDLTLSHYSPPPLSADQLLIENAYAGINYKDALSVTGTARISRLPLIIPGQDLSGTVIKSNCSHFEVGDQVVSFGGGLGETQNGAFSELCVINTQQAIKIPSHWNLKMAAAFGTAGFTAALAIEKLRWNRSFKDQMPILVTGASGGVGLHALMLLNIYKQKVDILSRDPKHKIFDRFNINRSFTFTGAKNNKLQQPKWSSVLDTLGGKTLAKLINQVKPWGQVICIGLVESSELKTSLMPFLVRGINLLGINASGCPVDLKHQIMRHVFDILDQQKYHMPIHTIGLQQLPDFANNMLKGQCPKGRTLIAFK